MKLIDDWKRQFPRLWSVRFAMAAAVMSGVEVGMNVYLTGKPPTIAVIVMLVSAASAVSRVVAQPSLTGNGSND